MAENRPGIHIIARASGLSYGEVKQVLYHIMLNTPQAEELARALVITLQGAQFDLPRPPTPTPDRP